MPSNLPLLITRGEISFMQLNGLAALIIDPNLSSQFSTLRGVERERKEFWRALFNFLYDENRYTQTDFDHLYYGMLNIPSLCNEYKAAKCVGSFEALFDKLMIVDKLILFLNASPAMSKEKGNAFINTVLEQKGRLGIQFFMDLFQALSDEEVLDIARVKYLIEHDQELHASYKAANSAQRYIELINKFLALDEFQNSDDEDEEEENHDRVAVEEALPPSQPELLSADALHLTFFGSAKRVLPAEQSSINYGMHS